MIEGYKFECIQTYFTACIFLWLEFIHWDQVWSYKPPYNKKCIKWEAGNCAGTNRCSSEVTMIFFLAWESVFQVNWMQIQNDKLIKLTRLQVPGSYGDITVFGAQFKIAASLLWSASPYSFEEFPDDPTRLRQSIYAWSLVFITLSVPLPQKGWYNTKILIKFIWLAIHIYN